MTILHSLTQCRTVYGSSSYLGKSSVTNTVQPDRKRRRPLMLRPPEGRNRVLRRYPQTRRGIGPACAHTPWAAPERRCYGTPLWDSFPVPLAVPLRLSV